MEDNTDGGNVVTEVSEEVCLNLRDARPDITRT